MLSYNRVSFIFFCLCALVPVLAVDLPKSMAFLPALAGAVGFALYRYGLEEKISISRNASILCLILFTLPLISLLWATHFDTSLSKVTQLLTILPPQILLISFVTNIPRDHIRPHAALYAYSMILGAILIILEVLSGGVIFNIFRGNALNTEAYDYEYNRAAVLLVMCGFSAIAILKDRFQHLLAPLLFIVPLFTALILSVCQAAQMMIFLGAIFYFLFPYRSKAAWVILKTLVLAPMLAAPFIVIYAFQKIAANLTQYQFMTEANASKRLEIWDYVSRYALESPFFGHGAEVTRAVKNFQCGPVFNTDCIVLHPHNFAIQIWVEFGLLGILIAMALMYKLITMIETGYSVAQQKILLPTLMMTLLTAAVSYGMWQGMWVGSLFFTAAMCIIACKIVDKGQNLA